MPVRVPDRIWVPGALGFVLAVLFVGALLVRADGDVSLLVHAGPPWTSVEGAPASLTVQDADDAFDGQFFYRIGVAPWSTDETVAGVTNDLPSLRNARWGYGALAWVVSGGDTDLVPWALVVVNVVAATAVGLIGGGLARSSGRHAAWGALFVLWPGFAYSLSMDTSELTASAFALGALLTLRHHRWVVAASLFTAAVITRDTAAVIPFGVALAGLVRLILPGPTRGRAGSGQGRRGAWGMVGAGSVPLVAFAAWQLVQRARFGSLPLTSSGDNNLSAPLAGLFDQLAALVPPSGADEVFRLICIVALVALLTVAAWTLWTDRQADRSSTGPTVPVVAWWTGLPLPRTGEITAWVGAVAVVVLLNAYLWSGATAFMRAATEAGLLSILVVLGARQRSRILSGAVGAGLAGVWALTAVAQLTKLG